MQRGLFLFQERDCGPGEREGGGEEGTKLGLQAALGLLPADWASTGLPGGGCGGEKGSVVAAMILQSPDAHNMVTALSSCLAGHRLSCCLQQSHWNPKGMWKETWRKLGAHGLCLLEWGLCSWKPWFGFEEQSTVGPLGRALTRAPGRGIPEALCFPDGVCRCSSQGPGKWWLPQNACQPGFLQCLFLPK
jgi:hypothetical protein